MLVDVEGILENRVIHIVILNILYQALWMETGYGNDDFVEKVVGDKIKLDDPESSAT
jgi:hypothetical protein